MIFFCLVFMLNIRTRHMKKQQFRANNLSKDQDSLIVLTFNMHRPLASFSATDTL